MGQWRNGERDAFERIRHRHPKFATADDSALAADRLLSDAQLVIARDMAWPLTALKQRIEANSLAKSLMLQSAQMIETPQRLVQLHRKC
jgi:hypothetical protein